MLGVTTEQKLRDVVGGQIGKLDGTVAETLAKKPSQDPPVAASCHRRESTLATEVLFITGLENGHGGRVHSGRWKAKHTLRSKMIEEQAEGLRVSATNASSLDPCPETSLPDLFQIVDGECAAR